MTSATIPVETARRRSAGPPAAPAPMFDETRMVAMVGHELRAPLATLAAAAELLQDVATADAETMVGAVNRQVRRLVWLFDAALRATELAAGGAADRDATAVVADVIGDVVDLVAEHDSRIDVTVACADALPPARIERAALAIVLNNLIANAMKHSGARSVGIAAHATRGWVHISVYDDGAGVPEHLRSRLFAEGARASATQGSGLGLHVSRTLVQRFGGDLRLVATESGAGFVIDLPATDGGLS